MYVLMAVFGVVVLYLVLLALADTIKDGNSRRGLEFKKRWRDQ